MEEVESLVLGAKARLLLEDAPPEIVFHYTSPIGLIGVLEKQEIWATDARYLNDSTELDYVRGIAANAAASVTALTAHARYLVSKLSSIRRDELFLGNIYVTSFSEKQDLLSQWRAYGGDGLGYALGFSTSTPLEPVSDLPHEPVSRYRRVIYEPCGPGGILWEAVSSVIRLVDGVDESIGSSAAEVAYQEIIGLLAAVYPVVKNEGFGEEAEWRVIFGNLAAGGYLAPLRFRPSGLGIAPFVPLRWKTDARLPPLAEVVMGPRIPHEEGSGALYMLLLATGHSAGCGEVKPTLSHSAVSYRR